MLRSLEYWRDTIRRLGLPEMPIAKATLPGAPSASPVRSELLAVASRCMRFTYFNSMEEMAKAGLPYEMVASMGRGQFPENLSLCFKIPPEYGGEVAFSNMFLIQKYPYLEMINAFLDEQMLEYNRDAAHTHDTGFALPPELFYPNPEGIVFLPALKGLASPGGNATTDKMTQIGSTMGLAAEAAAKDAAEAAAIQAAIQEAAGKGKK